VRSIGGAGRFMSVCVQCARAARLRRAKKPEAQEPPPQRRPGGCMLQLKRWTRKRTLAGCAVVAAAGPSLSACMITNQAKNTIAAAGSDTTQDVMGNILNNIQGNPDQNADQDTFKNILAKQTSPLLVPHDDNGTPDCGDITYHTPPG